MRTLRSCSLVYFCGYELYSLISLIFPEIPESACNGSNSEALSFFLLFAVTVYCICVPCNAAFGSAHNNAHTMIFIILPLCVVFAVVSLIVYIIWKKAPPNTVLQSPRIESTRMVISISNNYKEHLKVSG